MSKVRPQARKGGAFLLSTGVVLTVLSLFVGPANASGESTTATLTSPTSGTATTFVWSYQFNQNGGHSLSNIAIRFCDDSLLDHVVSAGPNAHVQPGGVTGGHAGFGPGIRFEVHDPSGMLTVTFDQAYAIAPQALEVESHSGDGQDGDVIATAAGPAAECATDDPTTTTVVDDPTTTTVVDDPTTTTVVDNPTTTTVVENPTTTTVVENPTTTTVVDDPTTTTVVDDPTTTTVVDDPTTTTVVDDPTTTTVVDPSTTTVVGDPTSTTAVVLGDTITTADGVSGEALASTGSNVRAQLALAGLALTLGGVAMTFGERKQRALAR